MHECIVRFRGKEADQVDITVQVREIEDEATVIRNGKPGLWTATALTNQADSVQSGASSQRTLVS